MDLPEFGDKVEFDVQRFWGERETVTIQGLCLGYTTYGAGTRNERTTVYVALDRVNHALMQIQGPWSPDRPLKFEMGDRARNSVDKLRKVSE